MGEHTDPGPAVTLRHVMSDDLPAFFDHQRDPEACAMALFPARDRDAFMAHWRKVLGDETVMARTIVCDGAVAGNVVSFDQGGDREVGYWIGRAHWGKGVATAALVAFLRVERRRPLVAHVATKNAASRRVLEKCGFAVRGRALASVQPEDRGATRGAVFAAGAPCASLEELIMRLE